MGFRALCAQVDTLPDLTTELLKTCDTYDKQYRKFLKGGK